MTKEEICQNIDKVLKANHSVILTGCHGIRKRAFITKKIPEIVQIPGKAYLDVSQWSKEDFYKNIKKTQMDFSSLILCIPNIFELKDSFSIINLLFSKHISFLGTSDFLIPTNDPEFSSISGRFETINVNSMDYRDWQRGNPLLPFTSFCLNDYPGYRTNITLLELIKHGLSHGKRVEEQSEKIFSLFQYVIKNEKAFSYRSLSEKTGYSINMVKSYIQKLVQMNLLYVIQKNGLDGRGSLKPKLIFYPTFASFYQFTNEDLAKEENVKTLYTCKLISKLLSYRYEISYVYQYSTSSNLANRFQECGLMLKKDDKTTYMQISPIYDEEKAKSLLKIKDGSPKYFVVFSSQYLQVLDNGLHLVDINHFIKGSLEEP